MTVSGIPIGRETLVNGEEEVRGLVVGFEANRRRRFCVVYDSSDIRFNSLAMCLTASLTMVLEPPEVGLVIRGRRWSIDVSDDGLFLVLFNGVRRWSWVCGGF